MTGRPPASTSRRRPRRPGCGWTPLVIAVVAGLGVGPVFAAGLPVATGALTAFRVCVLTATPSGTTVMADALANQASPNANTGSASTVNVRSNVGANRRTYLRFDLTACSPAIPAGAIVKVARLRLFLTAQPGSCRTEDVFRVAASWTEAGITWNNQPFGTTVNNPASGLRTDAITVGPSPCQNTATNAYVTGWVVTTDVQAFVSGSAINNGWMIRDDAENAATSQNATYATKEAANLSRAPQLAVTYSV
jgi:hypothetical protein